MARHIVPTANSRVVAHTQAATCAFSPPTRLFQLKETGRRSMLSFFIALTAGMPEAGESKKALLQEYQKRSKENKAKNDKERLDDYYKRNYKDYFELIEGPVKGKKEELLSESEKDILKWLQKNSR